MQSSNWNTQYPGEIYHVQDDIPGKTREQVVEAAYLSDRLYQLGGMNADLNLYKGPISFAIWEIMDPAPGTCRATPLPNNTFRKLSICTTPPNLGRLLPQYPHLCLSQSEHRRFHDHECGRRARTRNCRLFLLGSGLIGMGLIRRRRDVSNRAEPERSGFVEKAPVEHV
jgi:hypothetical protein